MGNLLSRLKEYDSRIREVDRCQFHYYLDTRRFLWRKAIRHQLIEDIFTQNLYPNVSPPSRQHVGPARESRQRWLQHNPCYNHANNAWLQVIGAFFLIFNSWCVQGCLLPRQQFWLRVFIQGNCKHFGGLSNVLRGSSQFHTIRYLMDWINPRFPLAHHRRAARTHFRRGFLPDHS